MLKKFSNRCVLKRKISEIRILRSMRIWEAIDQAFSMRKSGKVYVNEQKKTNSEYSEKSRNFLSLPREANNRERHKKRKRFFFYCSLVVERSTFPDDRRKVYTVKRNEEHKSRCRRFPIILISHKYFRR